MATRLTFHALRIHVGDDVDEYLFAPGVNVVTGSYATGKSSLFELIKYALGGRAAIMPALRANINRLSLDVTLGDNRVVLDRELGSNRINVSDSDGYVAEWSTTATKTVPRAGLELLRHCKLPQARLASQSRTKKSQPLSFFDFYRFCYLPQNDINRSIAGHDDQFLDRKRKAVFELAYGLADEPLRALEVEKQQMATQRAELDTRATTVSQFLLQSGAPAKDEVAPSVETLRHELEQSQLDLEAARRGQPPRGASAPIAGHAALLDLRREYVSASASHAALTVAVHRGEAVLSQLDLDRERELRSDSARASLTGLDFVVCPRCLQDIRSRALAPGECLLCTQPQPVQAMSQGHAERLARLDGQIAEARQLLEADRRDLEDAAIRSEALASAIEVQMRAVEVAFEEQDPALDRLVSEAQEVERTRARLRESERWLDSWSLHDRFLQEWRALGGAIKRNEDLQQELRTGLEGNRERVLQFSRTFEEEVRALGLLRADGEASIDLKDYLPVVDGDAFDELSVSGARKTLANVAYYLANFATSLSDAGILLPSVLLLDSPRTSLGDTPEDKEAGARIYYRLSLLAQAYPEAQILVADNGIGTDDRAVRRSLRITELSYESPLLKSVPHPARQGGDVEAIRAETVRDYEM